MKSFEVNSKHGNFTILVDDEDLERVSKHSWTTSFSHEKSNKTRFQTNINGKNQRLHRFILNIINPNTSVFHIDRNELNNQKNNLKIIETDNELLNKKFGRLLVIGFAGTKKISYKNHYKMWNCLCDCGKHITVESRRLNAGNTTSCGCNYRKIDNFDINKSILFNRFCRNHYNIYIQNAKVRKIKFDLTIEEFSSIVIKECFYCSHKGFLNTLACKTRSISFPINGIDRRNNKDYYHISNCVPCCKFCNRLKLASNEDQFHEWLDNIKQYNKKESEV